MELFRMSIERQSADPEQIKAKIEEFLGSDWNLKTFKGIFFEIMRVIQDPQSSPRDLAKVISMDPGLAARTLRIINSPYYALTSKVSDLTNAIVLLGFEMLKRIALSVSVFETFPPGTRPHLIRLWRNSLGVAKVGETLARERGRLSGEAYTIGLLHHIGKILLCSLKEKSYTDTLIAARKESLSDIEAERQILGFDHTEIGYVAAIHWELPPLVTEVIKSHHQELVGEKMTDAQYLSQMILLADEICSHLGLGAVESPMVIRSDSLVGKIPPVMYENLGFGREAFGAVVGKVAHLMKEINEFMQLLQIQ